MKYLKLFKSSYIRRLIDNLSDQDIRKTYLGKSFKFDDDAVLENKLIEIPDSIKLVLPKKGINYEFENSKTIFEALKNLTPAQASDVRIWTYFSHVGFWDYMRERSLLKGQPEDKRKDYILQHWFIEPLNAKNLLRQNISLLWWGAYMTYDKEKKDPYELTKELFSMLDYTRTLLPSTQGRIRKFVQAFLEFVTEKKDIFSRHKESRVRFLMRKANQVGGYKIFSDLSKEEIKKFFCGYKKELESIKGRD